MPRYAVEVTQVITRSMQLHVNASNAFEALDVANNTLTQEHVQELEQKPATIRYAFARPQVRRALPAKEQNLQDLETFLNANRQKH